MLRKRETQRALGVQKRSTYPGRATPELSQNGEQRSEEWGSEKDGEA